MGDPETTIEIADLLDGMTYEQYLDALRKASDMLIEEGRQATILTPQDYLIKINTRE